MLPTLNLGVEASSPDTLIYTARSVELFTFKLRPFVSSDPALSEDLTKIVTSFERTSTFFEEAPIAYVIYFLPSSSVIDTSSFCSLLALEVTYVFSSLSLEATIIPEDVSELALLRRITRL